MFTQRTQRSIACLSADRQRAAKGIKQAEYAKANVMQQIYAVNNIVGY
jgi:hypothetical protein